MNRMKTKMKRSHDRERRSPICIATHSAARSFHRNGCRPKFIILFTCIDDYEGESKEIIRTQIHFHHSTSEDRDVAKELVDKIVNLLEVQK